jgi:DNA-directed RNA polymerase subunit RPC12/RpoP
VNAELTQISPTQLCLTHDIGNATENIFATVTVRVAGKARRVRGPPRAYIARTQIQNMRIVTCKHCSSDIPLQSDWIPVKEFSLQCPKCGRRRMYEVTHINLRADKEP